MLLFDNRFWSLAFLNRIIKLYVIHPQLQFNAQNRHHEDLSTVVYMSLSLVISLFMRNFTAFVDRAKLMVVLINGALRRTKFCWQCMSAWIWWLFNHFKQRMSSTTECLPDFRLSSRQVSPSLKYLNFHNTYFFCYCPCT